MPKIQVIKANGDKQPLSLKKVYRAARRAGASRSLAEKTAQIIGKEAYSGITTSEIYQKVREILKQQEPAAALRFNLKEAIRKLGPTGFPFEKFVAELFSSYGWQTQTNQFLNGLCVSDYEIDFLATKGDLLYIGECKYRNLAGGRVHIDETLSNYARFLDIAGRIYEKREFPKKIKIKSLLVTNARFTSKSIQYANCVGIDLLGWKYPAKKGLETLIEEKKLYPLTALPSLKPFLASYFIKQGKTLVQDILSIETGKTGLKTNFPETKLKELKREAEIILSD